MKKILLILIYICALGQGITSAQKSIVKAEYFFDKDPGVGKAFGLTIPSTNDSIDFTRDISTASLSSGFHFLYLRISNDEGIWSLAEGRPFYLFRLLNPATGITTGEHFTDKDPGTGKGTPFTAISNNDTLNVPFDVLTSGLASGFHQLYTRIKDNKGVWSIAEGRPFYIIKPSPTLTRINKLEYYFDKDPGIGKGTPYDVNSTADSVIVPLSFQIQPLTPGFHIFYVRLRDASGKWSESEGRPLYIVPPSTIDAVKSSKIVGAEYFIDSDPGRGKANTFINVSGQDSIFFSKDLITSGLALGKHTLGIRLVDAAGKWSLTEIREFTVNNLQQQSITFTPIGNKTIDSPPFPISATTSSGLKPTYEILTGPAFISDSIITDGNKKDTIKYVHFTGKPGTVVVKIFQPGSDLYNPITELDTFIVGDTRIVQTITFADTIQTKYIGTGPFKVYANSTSALPITFSIVSGPATISGDIITLTGSTGIVKVKASQAGNSNYQPAPDAIRTFNVADKTVNKLTQIITFADTIKTKYWGNPAFKLYATASSGLPIKFTIVSGPATVSGDMLTINGEGEVIVKASQAGDATYQAATDVTIQFTAVKKPIAFSITTNSTLPICSGLSLQLSVPSITGASYTWTGPTGTIVSINRIYTINPVSAINAGYYKITAKAGLQTYTDSINVTAYPNPSADLKVTLKTPAQKCDTVGLVLTAVGLYSKFQWWLEGVKIANATDRDYSIVIPGKYTVEAFDANNCSKSQDTIIGNKSQQTIPSLIEERSPDLHYKTDDNGLYQYQWFVEDLMIVGANSSIYTPLYNGHYKIRVTYPDDCKTKLFSRIADISEKHFSPVLRAGLEQTDSSIVIPLNNSLENNITIFPIPTHDKVTISYTGLQSKKLFCSLTDLNGKILIKNKMQDNGNGAAINFDLQYFPSGMYIIFVEDDKTRIAKKLIKE